jgi:hypothetical protein
MDNSAEIFAKNISGTYEDFLYPRWSDNATYLDYGSGGFHIRNDTYQETMFMANNGNVGIGTVSPATRLHIADSSFPTLRVDSSSTAGTWLSLGNSSAGGRYWQLISSGSGNGGGAGKLIVAAGSSAGGSDANPMVIQDNGNVGIGTLTPGTRLEISAPTVADGVDLYGAGPAYFLSDANKNQQAALGVAASSGQYSTDAAAGDVVLRNSGSGKLFLQNGDGASGLALNNNNVGIGTPSPAAKLDVNGNIAMGNGQFFQARNNTNGLENFLWPRWTDNMTYLNYGAAGFNIRNNSSTTTMFMQNNGYVGIGTATPANQLDVQGNADFNGFVGIGTATPSKGQLEIDSANGVQPGYNPAGWLQTSGARSTSVSSGGDVSIWAAGWVFANTFIAFSDARIKNIQGQSDSTADLKTLLGIEVTDFTYKDTIAKGNRPQKKVIAQQVEQAYPQAVSKSTDVVPDIYRNAKLKDGWVQLATDLKVGERVKLIGEKEKGIYAVLEVRDGAFRTDFKPATEQVFVYGREVKDFRSVDYEAISMLNVSATQELAKRVSALEAHEAERLALEKRAARVDELESELADLKAVVARLAQSQKHQASLRGGKQAMSERSGALVAADIAGGVLQQHSTAQPGE